MLYEFQQTKITLLNYQENIKRIETIFRNSLEYKSFVSYIYSCKDTIVSPDYKDIILNDNKDFKSECHHTIFTLYDIVELVIVKLLSDEYETTIWDILKIVSEIHLSDKVCVSVISKSFHDAVHMGKRKIDKDTPGLHLGNVADFVKEYREYITDDKVNELERLGMIYEK